MKLFRVSLMGIRDDHRTIASPPLKMGGDFLVIRILQIKAHGYIDSFFSDSNNDQRFFWRETHQEWNCYKQIMR
jgi:hypothetical protein